MSSAEGLGGSATVPEASAVSSRVNTYDYAWIIISFLISFLWFRINHAPVFPLGLAGGLAISYMIHRIDRSLGKQSYLNLAIPLSVIGCFIGIFLSG